MIAPYNNEGQDGYDTIEWIIRQSWCSGRVGMTGGSYVGAVQWQAAVEQIRFPIPNTIKEACPH